MFLLSWFLAFFDRIRRLCFIFILIARLIKKWWLKKRKTSLPLAIQILFLVRFFFLYSFQEKIKKWRRGEKNTLLFFSITSNVNSLSSCAWRGCLLLRRIARIWDVVFSPCPLYRYLASFFKEEALREERNGLTSAWRINSEHWLVLEKKKSWKNERDEKKEL